MSVKEHTERVRFDPGLVERKVENNKFKLIYPNNDSQNSDLYEKILKKASDMWKETTGTVTKERKIVQTLGVMVPDPPKKVKKKKPKKIVRKNDDDGVTSANEEEKKGGEDE